MKPLKIAISVGHNPRQPGFKVGAVSEYSEMAVLLGFLVSKLSQAGQEAYIIGTGSLEQKVEQINSSYFDCAIELHLNAGGGHGFETLYCPGSVKGKKLATSVHSAIGLVLRSRDRGVKEGWYRMDKPGVEDYPGDIEGDEVEDYFLKFTNCWAVITEIYFLDSAAERAKFTGSSTILADVASRIAVGILDCLKGGSHHV